MTRISLLSCLILLASILAFCFSLGYSASNPAAILDKQESFPNNLTKPQNASVPAAISKPLIMPPYGRLPLYFIANRGQVDKRVKYYVRTNGQTTFFTKGEVVLALSRPSSDDAAKARGPVGAGLRPAPTKAGPGIASDKQRQPETKNLKLSVIRIKPVGLNKDVKISPLGLTGHRVNYFIGNDSKKWRTDIPTYQAVNYENAYAGIDLKFYGQGRQLEYDIVVKPGADPNQVWFAYQGIKKLEVTPVGDLALLLPDGGRLLQKKPLVYQEIAGQRFPREGKYRLHRQGAALTCGFAVAAYDQRYPLIIDPIILDYSTCLGGDWGDMGVAIAVDGSDYAYVVGTTNSENFPKRNYYQTYQGSMDVFVTRLAPAGNSLVYSTFLGGSGYDSPGAIAVNAGGQAFVTGYTNSGNFPILNQYQGPQGYNDVFVTKLGPTGALLYSTYLGGPGSDGGWGIAVDGNGQAYVTGETQSGDNFPTTTNAFQEEAGSNYDAFVTKLSAAGNTLVYSTFLGGREIDVGRSIAVDSSGHAYVTGQTASANFPSLNTYQGFKGVVDAFVTKLSPLGDALIYSTWLGGGLGDVGFDLAVDNSGHAYVTGWTNSISFPTQNAYQGEKWAGYDAFVTKLGPAGNTLVYSTFLGGEGDDWGRAIALDGKGSAYVAGSTNSGDFPKRNYYQTYQGLSDVFLTKLTPGGNDLVYSTFLGGAKDDYGYGIAVDGLGHAYVTGATLSTDFPTKNPYMEYWGYGDAFVSKFMEKSKYSYGALLLNLLTKP